MSYIRLTRQEKTCNGSQTKEIRSGGVYIPPATIWETIASHGVTGVDVTFVYQYRAIYDYESFFNDAELPHVKTANS